MRRPFSDASADEKPGIFLCGLTPNCQEDTVNMATVRHGNNYLELFTRLACQLPYGSHFVHGWA
jgi:hypothetical protein